MTAAVGNVRRELERYPIRVEVEMGNSHSRNE